MNLNNYVENQGKRNKIIFVLIDLEKEIKGDIVSILKTKRQELNAPLKRNLVN